MKPGILHYPLAKWERVPRSSKSRKGVGGKEGEGKEGEGKGEGEVCAIEKKYEQFNVNAV